ncbi:unnamed protein product [Allacma fusca]|uniref:Uncharacterized protein n=1 Tax=Allacma fusca TaxID=39272 RepID=A0A8J2NT07_9HEXA|nr:unnamed protein product [Allacma fusca]
MDGINQHRERLSNFYARHGSNNLTPEHANRAMNMLVKWKWSLMAGDSFEVNNGIIPLVIGTIIFQIKNYDSFRINSSKSINEE